MTLLRKSLLVAPLPLDTQSGIVGNIQSVVDLLLEAGYQTDVVCFRAVGGPLRSRVATVVAPPEQVSGYIKVIAEAIRRLLGRRYDVLLFPAVKTPLLVPLAVLARILGVDIVYDMQDVVPEITSALRETPPGTRHAYTALCSVSERILVGASSLVIFTAEVARYLVSRRNNKPISQTAVLYNAHSAELRSTSAGRMTTDEHLRIVYLGGLQPVVRGLEAQLQALKILNDGKVPVRLYIVSPEQPGEFGAMVQNLGLGNVVQFTGFLPRDRAHELVATCDIAIMNQVPYAVPSKFFECVALGLCIVTRRDCLDLARLVPPELLFDGTPEDLASVLIRARTRLPEMHAAQRALIGSVSATVDRAKDDAALKVRELAAR